MTQENDKPEDRDELQHDHDKFTAAVKALKTDLIQVQGFNPALNLADVNKLVEMTVSFDYSSFNPAILSGKVMVPPNGQSPSYLDGEYIPDTHIQDYMSPNFVPRITPAALRGERENRSAVEIGVNPEIITGEPSWFCDQDVNLMYGTLIRDLSMPEFSLTEPKSSVSDFIRRRINANRPRSSTLVPPLSRKTRKLIENELLRVFCLSRHDSRVKVQMAHIAMAKRWAVAGKQNPRRRSECAEGVPSLFDDNNAILYIHYKGKRVRFLNTR